jgi:uncharacterized delta-60 repeat protein
MRRKLLSHLTLKPLRVAVVAAIASLVFSTAAMAAAGDLDPTFSGDGKQISNFGRSGPSGAEAVVRQADGKIVAVGGADNNFLVARYNLDGSLDSSFSGDGRRQTNFAFLDRATDVALQGNKIVVVGYGCANTQTCNFALARYNPDGSLDPNFSGDGKQTTAIGSFGDARPFGVALQSDGKIVAVGSTNIQGINTRDFALARYNLNGSLDTSFSGDGLQTTDFGDFDGAVGVAIQADDKIVAFGNHPDDTHPPGDFALARYNLNGSLDTSFSGDGLQTTDFGVGASGTEVAIQGDGKIVAVGQNGDGDFALARYIPDGSLDTSFSGDGLQTTDFLFGSGDLASDVAIQANGRIVAVGFATGGATGSDFALARYNPDGSLDTTFSGDGRKRTSFGTSSDGFDVALGVALQGDGRIVAVGTGGAGDGRFGLARYLGG